MICKRFVFRCGLYESIESNGKEQKSQDLRWFAVSVSCVLFAQCFVKVTARCM